MNRIEKQAMRLYAVTDRAWTGRQSLYEQVEEALQNGVTCLQLREKHLSDEEFLQEAKSIGQLCRKYNIPFIINDNVKIAIKSGADGVHIGQDDMDIEQVRALVGDRMIIGATAHNLREALEAEAKGADYLGLGAVFTTSTKGDTVPLSLNELKEICSRVRIPKVAIAGINATNITQLNGTGVDGVAVISAIFAAEDIASATQELRQLANVITTSQ